jgi:hypothetical protein
MIQKSESNRPLPAKDVASQFILSGGRLGSQNIHIAAPVKATARILAVIGCA